MRITSPKGIHLKNFQSIKISQLSASDQKDNQYGINARQGFQSRPDSMHSGSCAVQYALESKVSTPTGTFISNRSGRSRSNHHGISMAREKTIRIDNIYEPQHFGEVKNSQSYSTKSITQLINNNTKSVSRLTRATSPTTTTYPEKRQSRFTTNDNTASKRASSKELSQSCEQDAFDFRDLKKEISKAGQKESRNQCFLGQNQDYYGRSNQLTQNRQFLAKNKQSKDCESNSYCEDYSFQQKSQHRMGSNSRVSRHSIFRKQSSVNSENRSIKNQQTEKSREKSPSVFLGICTNNKSQNLQTLQRDNSIVKPYSPSPNSKLGWRDVVKR